MTEKRFNKIRENIKCLWCGDSVSGHKRCVRCEILLHRRNPEYIHNHCKVQHNFMGPDMRHCKECWDDIKKET